MAHTKIKVNIENGNVYNEDRELILCVIAEKGGVERKAHIKHMVKSWNSHDELLEALIYAKEELDYLISENLLDKKSSQINKVNKAINNAK